MGDILETMYGVLFHPVETMRELAVKKPVGWAVGVFLITAVFLIWVGFYSLRDMGLAWVVGVFAFGELLGGMIWWFVSTGVLQLIAEFLGGTGSGISLFTVFGFARLPRITSVPVWAISFLLPGFLRPLWLGLGTVAIGLWVLALHVIGLKVAHEFSTARALLVVLIPGVVAGAVIILGIILIISGAAGFLPHLQDIAFLQ